MNIWDKTVDAKVEQRNNWNVGDMSWLFEGLSWRQVIICCLYVFPGWSRKTIGLLFGHGEQWAKEQIMAIRKCMLCSLLPALLDKRSKREGVSVKVSPFARQDSITAHTEVYEHSFPAWAIENHEGIVEDAVDLAPGEKVEDAEIVMENVGGTILITRKDSPEQAGDTT